MAAIFATQDNFMKKIVFSVFTLLSLTAFAQTPTTDPTPKKKKDWSKIDLSQSGDHFMIQMSSDHWSGVPDSIKSHMGGFSRGLNIYLMMNKPFKSDPRWSVAFGVGIGSSSMFFKKMAVDVTATGTTLPFVKLDSTDHFKKYKLATTFLEIPIELRYTLNPQEEGKSWKMAVGVKVGTMVNAHTKGKTLEDKNGNTLNSYTEKESKRTFFNGTRLVATARIGRGHFSLFGNYTLTSFLKDGAGPAIKPYQIGLCISGL